MNQLQYSQTSAMSTVSSLLERIYYIICEHRKQCLQHKMITQWTSHSNFIYFALLCVCIDVGNIVSRCLNASDDIILWSMKALLRYRQWSNSYMNFNSKRTINGQQQQQQIWKYMAYLWDGSHTSRIPCWIVKSVHFMTCSFLFYTCWHKSVG